MDLMDITDVAREPMSNPVEIGVKVVKKKLEDEYSFISTEEAKYGDVIFCCRCNSLYKHFGIYLGDGKVIHYVSLPGDSDMDHAVILETDMEAFSKGDTVYVMKFPKRRHVSSIICKYLMTEDYHLYSPEETVLRAKSKLGQHGIRNGRYNLLENNCEHFAIWCKTGVMECWQLRMYMDALLP